MATQVYTPERIIQALEDSRGVKRRAAKLLGCDRKTIDNYIERYPTIEQELERINEDVNDDIEHAFLEEALVHRNTACLLKAVSTRLRHRGYGDRVAVQHGGKLSIEVTLPQAMLTAPHPLEPLPAAPVASVVTTRALEPGGLTNGNGHAANGANGNGQARLNGHSGPYTGPQSFEDPDE